jgi:hypothetical protein
MGAKWILNVKDYFGVSAGVGISKNLNSILWVAKISWAFISLMRG